MDNYKTIAQCARHLGRTYSAIRHAAQKHRIGRMIAGRLALSPADVAAIEQILGGKNR